MRRTKVGWLVPLVATVAFLALAVQVRAGSYQADWIAGTNASSTNWFLGKTGIGTNSPTTQLQVSGDGRVDGALDVKGPVRIPQQGDVGMGEFLSGESLYGVAGGATTGSIWSCSLGITNTTYFPRWSFYVVPLKVIEHDNYGGANTNGNSIRLSKLGRWLIEAQFAGKALTTENSALLACFTVNSTTETNWWDAQMGPTYWNKTILHGMACYTVTNTNTQVSFEFYSDRIAPEITYSSSNVNHVTAIWLSE